MNAFPKGRVHVITGAGSGIGRALSEGFSALGHTVIGFSRQAHELEKTSDRCPGMVSVCGDITQQQDVERLVTTALDRFGRIDVLINNAGQNLTGNFLDTPFADWSRIVETNLLGLAYLTHRVLPVMVEQSQGRIDNVVSRAPEACFAGTSPYAVSKGAVILLTRVLAQEISAMGQNNILINDLVPGPTRSGMTLTGQEPVEVFPFVRELVELPAGGPSGKVFFRGNPYVPWSHG